MIVLIDNYDSFTYNVFHYLSEIGSTVKVYRNDKITIDQILDMKPQGIVISPGPKTPNDAGICLNLIKKQLSIPILGICLGHQSIGQAYGGKIIKCKEIMHGKIDTINHFKHPLFAGIDNPFKATRYHSLIIDRESFQSKLEIICETNNKIIMGIADNKRKIYGIQFHPESIGTEIGKLIFKNFLNIINYEF